MTETDMIPFMSRDVCVIPGNRIVSVGLDKTVRVAEVQ